MIVRLFLFCLICLTLPTWVKFSFRLPPQNTQILFHPEWEVPLSAETKTILSQPFTYLDRGNQTTVFLSQDGQYVLKLFRYRRSRFAWIESIKGSFARFRHKKPKHALWAKMQKTLEAAHLAYTEGRSFTQLVYIHLNITENLLPTVTLKAHQAYHLPLDKYRFVIQRKATPFKEALLAAKKQPAKMHQCIDSLVDLLHARSAHGIQNADPNLGPNFGFIDERAVEIDFGNYRKSLPDPARQSQEIAQYFGRFAEWLQKNCPEYIPYLQQKIAIPYHGTNEETSRPARAL